MNKEETLSKMNKMIDKGNHTQSYYTTSSDSYLHAIALGIQYLVENSKERPERLK